MSDYTQTPVLGLYKPTYDADAEQWGLHLNENADVLDAAFSPTGGVFLPINGGVMNGMLTLFGPPANPLDAATKSYVDSQITSGIPGASTTLPLMSGTALVGSGLTWARADHVHPSDTSRLALTGGAVIGPTTFAGLLSTTTSNIIMAGDQTAFNAIRLVPGSPGSHTVISLQGPDATTYVDFNTKNAGYVTVPRLNVGAPNAQGITRSISTNPGAADGMIFTNFTYTGTNAANGNQNFAQFIVHDNVAKTGSGLSNIFQTTQYTGANSTSAGGIWSQVTQEFAPTGNFGFMTAVTAATQLSFNCGGTDFTNKNNVKGAATALNSYSTALSGATFLSGLVGYEMDIQASAGSSLGNKIGLFIVLRPLDAVAGQWGLDTAVSITAATSTVSNGWDYLIGFGNPSTQIPYKPTATFLKSWDPQTPVNPSLATWGIDFFSTTFSAGFAKAQGFMVDGAGNVTAQQINTGGFAITPSGSTLTIDRVGQVGSLVSIAAGGSNFSVGDKVTTAAGGLYVATAVTGGSVTAVMQLVPDVAASPPTNPVPTTSTANFGGNFWHVTPSGLTLNLSWSSPTATVALQTSGGPTTVGGNLTAAGALASGTLAVTNNATVGGTLGVTGNITAPNLSRTLYATGVLVSSGADTTEDTLQSYSLPAGTLANVGDRIRITAGGSFAANTDAKTARVRFGPTQFQTAVSSNAANLNWQIVLEVQKTGANTQSTYSIGFTNAQSPGVGGTTASALTDTAAIAISATGQNSTNPTAGSVGCRYFVVEYLR